MGQTSDSQWSIGDELYESRDWAPNRANLGDKWQSAASQILRVRQRDRSPPGSDGTPR
jgi:hypothetical protein